MINTDNNKFAFPVGYHKFHKDQVFNFQLNRGHSLGYTRFEDMKKVGKGITNFDDWKIEMERLAEEALSEKRYMNAAFNYRAAEFYILEESAEKQKMYENFSEYFYRAFKDEGIERFQVPYEKGAMPAIRLKASGEKKGTILIHGGFDSFIEEWYSPMKYFSDHGYEAIGFEGPGQGNARRKYKLAFDYRWEKPTKIVLDYFKLDDVTLLGFSMGGWFCFRVAAFEPRIKRVIASSIAYDYIKSMDNVFQRMHILFARYLKKISNKMLLNAIKKRSGMQAWQAFQMMYITKKKTPVDAIEEILFKMNEENLHSELVKQDVLILTGRNDHFIPFKAHKMQIGALTNAKSVTAKVFTKETHANNHCQIGNTGLMLDSIVEWIEEIS
ncbi:MAG: alpha/beta hydrolase [Desulfobacterales bacterium]|nr:alpha/beta hydrolase [Desulfobacterales bacterium]